MNLSFSLFRQLLNHFLNTGVVCFCWLSKEHYEKFIAYFSCKHSFNDKKEKP